MKEQIPRELDWPPVGRIVAIEPANSVSPLRITYDTGTVVEVDLAYRPPTVTALPIEKVYFA